MMISENEGDRPEDISEEEATKVAREMAEELGLNVHGSMICPNCEQVIENKLRPCRPQASRPRCPLYLLGNDKR